MSVWFNIGWEGSLGKRTRIGDLIGEVGDIDSWSDDGVTLGVTEVLAC